MLQSIRKQWRAFKARPPGRRFQDVHRARAKQGQSPRKWISIIAGGLLAAVGLFFMAVPGPGLPVLAVGLALIARQSMTIARLLDWLEVKLRAVMARLRRLWQHGPPSRRIGLAAVAALLLAAGAAAVWFIAAGN